MKTYKELVTPTTDEPIDDISDDEIMEILNDQYNNPDELTESRLNLIKGSMIVLSGKLISTLKMVESENDAVTKLNLISRMVKYNGRYIALENSTKNHT